MNSPHDDIILHMKKQAIILGKARDKYLAKEAEKKHFEATLTGSAKGKSHAERVTAAHADKVYLEFHVTLARLKSIYEFQDLSFKILEFDFWARYKQNSLDHRLISKGVD